MGKIFGIRFRAKPTSGEGDQPPDHDGVSTRRRTRLTRTLLLVPALVLLFFMSVVEHGHPAVGKAGKTGLLAALADPLSLFAARSPGARGGGALLSTKGGPSERVLSTIRDRDPPPDPPGADNPGLPVTPEDVAALAPPAEGAAPGDGGGSGDPGPGGPSFGSFAPFSAPGGGGGFFPGGGAPTFVPPPGSPPPGGGGGVSAVPEPATWAMMIIGFFSVGAMVRRRARKETVLSCARQ